MAKPREASVADWKRELVNNLVDKFEDFPAVGVMNISGIPAPQFQGIREVLRGKAEIKVSRKVLLEIAIEKASDNNPGLSELSDYLEGQCALVFTKMNPFKLWKLLDENKTSAPAKIGMESPEDIVIPEGETDFSPGPVISELQQGGVKARIQAGKVVVVEDSKIVEEGEPISEDVVGVLSRFGIEPREIGFELLAAYEDGTVFPGDMLSIDEEETVDKLIKAHSDSFGLSLEIGFPTARGLPIMLGRASNAAHNLALNASIFNSDIMPNLLSKAHSDMLGLASSLSSANPEAVGDELRSKLSEQKPVEKPKKEEEKPKEEEVEEETEETEEEEEEAEAGLGGLFD